jgi:hypothetical protein
MHNHAVWSLDLKQYPVLADPQPVFRGERRQAFYVSGKVVFELFQCANYSCRIKLGDSTQIFPGSRLQFDYVLHGPAHLLLDPDQFHPTVAISLLQAAARRGARGWGS